MSQGTTVQALHAHSKPIKLFITIITQKRIMRTLWNINAKYSKNCERGKAERNYF
jgi:hypothetical protein